MSPALDTSSAPFTGWTRAHWEDVADGLLVAPRRYATPGHALIHLPGPVSKSGRWSDGFEGFARTFLLAGFRLAGADGHGADLDDLAGWYAEGIAAGVDPASPERWPTIAERRQATVEAASVAIALSETRPWIWDRLSGRTREQVVDWLAGIVGTGGYGNNWVWFQNVVEAFLRSVGGPWNESDIERNLAAHESWYVGDGWYTDGGTRNFDYYVGWAMHFYPAWYVRMDGPGADELRDTYRARLRRFLQDAQHLVAADGAPLFQGRSLTYRFAMLAPFWAGELADASPLEPGVTRRLASGVLKYFVEHGATDDAGLLPIGWHGAFPRIRQLYSGGGSPYWASKAFAGLVLPADHPAWSDVELPLPVERSDTMVTLAHPRWIVAGTKADGIVRVVNHGTDHAAGRDAAADLPFYARHGYATHAAPELSQRDAQHPLDSHVALMDTDGALSHRTPIAAIDVGLSPSSTEESVSAGLSPSSTEKSVSAGLSPSSTEKSVSAGLGSRNRVHWWDPTAEGGNSGDATSFRAGPWLTTASVVRGAVEVRLARVDPVDPASGRPGTAGDDEPDAHLPVSAGPWRLHIGGWAIASDGAAPTAQSGAGRATATTGGGLTSVVLALRGLDDAGVRQSAGTSPLGEYSATPWARTSGPVAYGSIYAAAIVLAGTTTAAEDAARVELTVSGDQVTVTWASGDSDTVFVPGPA